MFTVRGEELGTVLVPRLEQRLEDLAGERKDLVKIDERMLDGDSADVLGVEEAQVPDGSIADVVAEAFPCLCRRVLPLALLGGVPGRPDDFGLSKSVIHAYSWGLALGFRTTRLGHTQGVAPTGFDSPNSLGVEGVQRA
jgi:hypothetical protein